MDYAKLRAIVSRSWYETSMADAFRRALGVITNPADRPKRRKPLRKYERMMANRYGACERHGKS